MSTMFPDGKSDVAHIATLTGDAREDALTIFLRAHEHLFLAFADRSINHHRTTLREHHLRMDVAQIYRVTAFQLIEEETRSPGAISGLPNRWEAILAVRGRAAAREFLDRDNPVASSAFQRRTRYLAQRQSDFTATHGRAPSDEELLDYVQAVAQANRKDPRRQSMTFTARDIADFRAHATMSSSQAPAIIAAFGRSGVTTSSPDTHGFEDEDINSDAILTRAESPQFIAQVVARAQEVSARCGIVATHWFGEYLTAKDDRRVLDADEIANLTGLTTKQVHVQQSRIRELAIDVAVRFGITPDVR